MKIFLNGNFIPLNKSKISPCDMGFLYGAGAFETLRSFDGYIPFIDRHYRRLKKTLKLLDINFNLSYKDIKKIIYKLLKINKLKNAYIRITVSSGTDKNRPTIFILLKKIDIILYKSYLNGVVLSISKYNRNYSILSNYKTLNYLENLLERRKANKQKYFDTIFLDITGKYITECTSANIFVVKNNIVYTPEVKNFPVLGGITREIVIEILKKNKINIIEKKITKSEMFTADEIFITNSLIGIVPVKRINKFFVSENIPGKITEILINKYNYKIKTGGKKYAKL